MVKIKIIITAILILSVLTYSVLEIRTYDMKTINDFLKDQVDHGKTPSIQYAFFDLDSTIYEMYYGFKNVKSAVPADSSTTYSLYSVTKTFTALSVLQLAQAGKIDLGSPVSKYLPDFPYSKDITVEQLLSHTAGIPNPLPLRWIHLAEEHEAFYRDEFFKEVFKNNYKLKSAPGTKFSYSNLGYVLLGQLIEKVSGQSYESYVTENITERIGVDPKTLGFQINPSVHATGYHKWWSLGNFLFGFLIDKEKFMGNKEGKWKPFQYFHNNGTAYGGMVGSAPALIKYAQALLQEKSILLNDQYRDILFTEKKIDNKATGMALSWYSGTVKGNQYYCHAGGGGGYYVELRVYPDLGVGSVILYNRSGMTDERILDRADSFFLTKKDNL
jgi:D-alanyl-D-alanine carboxypeptidase